jgi:thymidine kinase
MEEEAGAGFRTMEEILQGEDLEDVLLKARMDPKFFFDRIIGLGHRGISKDYEVKPFHIEWFNMFLQNKRNVIDAPRGYGKTEILAVLFFIYIALFFKNKSFIIISKDNDMAKEIIRRVRDYIDSNALLNTLKPNTYELSWKQTMLTTTTKCIIFCKHYSSNIRTWHVDYVLCDEAAYYEDKSIYYHTILPIANTHNANVMVISTPQTKVDLLAELSKKTGYIYKHYCAYELKEEDGKRILDRNKSMWPEHFPVDRLKEMEMEQGASKFAREYLCEVQTSDTSWVPINMIESACDDTLSMTFSEDAPTKELDGTERKRIYHFSADFAVSAKGNYSVFLIGEEINGKIVVRYMYRPKRGTPQEEQINIIKQMYDNFHFEAGLGDKGHAGILIVEQLINSGLPITGFDFQGKKEELMIQLRKAFENKRVVIPTNPNDEYTKQMSDVLIREISELTEVLTKTGKPTVHGIGAYDDAAMALALLVKSASEYQEVEAMIEFA